MRKRFLVAMCFPVFLSLFIVQCWAEVRGLKESVIRSYKFVEKFGEYESEIEMQTVLKYDEMGNMIEFATYDSEGKLELKHIYKYDEMGNTIKNALYNSKGIEVWRYVYEYDDRGNMIEFAQYTEGSLDSRSIYKYDERGNKIKVVTYDSVGNLELEVFKYDEKGNKVEVTTYNSKEELESKWIYKYDEKGNKVEVMEYGYEFYLGELQEIPVTKFIYEHKYYWVLRFILREVLGEMNQKIKEERKGWER